MRTILPLLVGAILAIAILPLPLHAAASVEPGMEAPHFEIGGATPGTDVFPLKGTQVRTRIAGVIAEVEVVQTYANLGDKPLEAVYVFPGSTRAAVQGMEIKIGERIIKAEIQERAQAQKTYATAKAQNKTAGLLQQHRPNVFQMSVANILPGAEVQVRLLYTEKLAPVERIYEWVLPGVVGPRYENGQGGSEAWQSNPFLNKDGNSSDGGKTAPAGLDFALQMDAGLPVKSLTSPSHDLDIQFQSATSAAVKLKPGASYAANRDLIVRYQLADKKISTGLLLHEGKGGKDDDENFFLLNVQPPERVTSAEVPARDYLFIVDISGSMSGFPIETAKQLMSNLLGTLREKDKFNVLLFAGSNEMLADQPLSATMENVTRVNTLIQRARSSGGTEILPALTRALAMQRDEGMSRSIVLITDGLVTVETRAFDLIREKMNEANVFTFGIGSSVNRHLLEGLARVGKGEVFVVTRASECTEAARRFQQYVSAPVLTSIQVRGEGFEMLDLEPAQAPDLFADRPLEIAGKWKGRPGGKIIVTGNTAGGKYEMSFDVAAEAVKGKDHAVLRPLWARERARLLGDYAALNDNNAKTELTKVGLKYGLLTEQTSFVAVDEQVQQLASTSGSAEDSNSTTVRQPVPLPAGMSTSQIKTSGGGGVSSSGSVPEPGTMGLVVMVLSLVLLNRRRA